MLLPVLLSWMPLLCTAALRPRSVSRLSTGSYQPMASGLPAMQEGQVIATTQCDGVRSYTSFNGRLDIFYFYYVEYTHAEDSTGLISIERGLGQAVRQYVAAHMNHCDLNGRPLFALVSSPNDHELGERECRYARGITSILLDNETSQAEAMALLFISEVLNNTEYLNQFVFPVQLVETRFLRLIGDHLVLLVSDARENGKDSTTQSGDRGHIKIAFTAALVSFVLTGIAFFSIYRNQEQRDYRCGGRGNRSSAYGHAKRRKYFQQLDDSHIPAGWLEPDHIPAPSITWSVSDLTSDSQSLRGSLPLDRIEEESADDDDQEDLSSTEPHRSSPTDLGGVPEHFSFIAHWIDPLGLTSSEKACSPSGLKGIEALDTEIATCDDGFFDEGESTTAADTPTHANTRVQAEINALDDAVHDAYDFVLPLSGSSLLGCDFLTESETEANSLVDWKSKDGDWAEAPRDDSFNASTAPTEELTTPKAVKMSSTPSEDDDGDHLCYMTPTHQVTTAIYDTKQTENLVGYAEREKTEEEVTLKPSSESSHDDRRPWMFTEVVVDDVILDWLEQVWIDLARAQFQKRISDGT